MSSKENDSQSQQEEMQNRDVEMMGPREDVQVMMITHQLVPLYGKGMMCR